MSDSYRVRGGIEDVSDDTTTAGEAKQAAREVKELGTVDASFSRGQLYLLEDEVVFAKSENESTIRNAIDNVFSKGPFNPLRTLGIYKPYEAPLTEADENPGSWRVPYGDIEAVSLVSKALGYEIYLRPTGDPGYLYRIRNDQGTDYVGFRWLHSPNHDTAVRIAGELFERASRRGPVETFDAGRHFTGQTKQIDFPTVESSGVDGTQSQQATATATPEAERQSTGRSTADDRPGTASERQRSGESTARGSPDSSHTEPGTGEDGASEASNRTGGGKILAVGLSILFVLGPLVAIVFGSTLVSSVAWGLGTLVSLFGLGRLIRGYLGT